MLKKEVIGSMGKEGQQDEIYELICNIDDMTGEDLGYTMEILMQKGALDVFYQAIQMKKNRPGVILHCLCKTGELEYFAKLILTYTTSRGVRYQRYYRFKLDVEMEEIETEYGTVHNKKSAGFGIKKEKLEFDDLKHVAEKTGLSLMQVREKVEKLKEGLTNK